MSSGSFADTEVYQSMIDSLNQYVEAVSDACSNMQGAAEDCVDNCGEDPAASKCSEQVGECTQNISNALQQVEEIIAALQETIRKIEEAHEGN